VLLLLPVLGNHWLLWGLVLSLGLTAVQLLVVFPLKAGKGAFGLDLGAQDGPWPSPMACGTCGR